MKSPTRSLPLFILALFLAILALALPGKVSARSACSSNPCTYNGWLGNYPGTCGPHGSECYCFENTDPDNYHQLQAACIVIE